MKDRMILTLANFTDVLADIKLYTSEAEIIDFYGLTAFDFCCAYKCAFILGDYFWCDDCNSKHTKGHLIGLNKGMVSFTLPIAELNCFGELMLYAHKDELVACVAGNDFEYDPITKSLIIYGSNRK